MIYVFLADGFEEAEALVTVDILRRAEIDVALVGVTGKEIVGTHGITVKAEKSIYEVDVVDGVILPGGMPGTTNLEASRTVCNLVKQTALFGGLTAAICAAPSVLGHLGLLKGKSATCYPGFEDELIGAEYSPEPVVADGNIITAKGAGSVFEFGFKLVEYIKGEETAQNIRESMQCVR